MQFTPTEPALNAKKVPKSTKVVVIDNTPSVDPLRLATEGALAAGKAAGLKPTLLNGGANNTPSDDNQLLQQAVNLHPAVVIQVGILTNLETAGLKYAKAHGVPVIAAEDDPPNPGSPGEGSGPLVTATAGADFAGEGKVIAEYIAKHGPSDAQIGVITTNNIVPSNVAFNAFKKTLSTVCPDCSIVSSDVDTTHWTSQAASTVTSMLAANPKMDYLFPVVDGMAPLITPSLRASSHHVKVVSCNATPGAAMSAVKSGTFAMEVGTSNAMTGWYAFDAALRIILKLPTQTHPLPPLSVFTTALMTKNNLDPTNDTSLFGDAYKAGFLKLWGIGG